MDPGRTGPSGRPEAGPPSAPSGRLIDTDAATARLWERRPLTHCITNRVVMGFTANVLLAAGASPAMIEDPGEAAEFAAVADAVLINVGTLTVAQADAMRAAVAAAQRAGTPWVLDPVAVGPLKFRTVLAVELLGARPAIVRGNASEILSLAGAAGAGRGVESGNDPTEAVAAARELAGRHGCVVAVSGETDLVVTGPGDSDVVPVTGGDPMMTLVTGVGCALGALMASYAGVSDARTAAVTASAVFARAGAAAATRTGGPGSFAVGFLDELARPGQAPRPDDAAGPDDAGGTGRGRESGDAT